MEFVGQVILGLKILAHDYYSVDDVFQLIVILIPIFWQP